MPRRAFGLIVFAVPVLAALISGCGSPAVPTATVVSDPTEGLVSVTTTLSGTLVSGGTNLHTFHTMQGLVNVTLVSLDPAADAPLLGMGIGMWDGASCQMVLETATAIPTANLIGTAALSSTVCVKVWDPSTLASDASLKYQLTAVHNEQP
jgi:hypothetical protein